MSTSLKTRGDVVTAIEQCGVVAVIRLQDPQKLRGVAGGVRALEVTMTVPGAIRLIEQIAPTLPPEFILGAGTILDAETARMALLAGARYIVSPVYRREVVAMCHRYDAAAMPGCFTPTEILDAWETGADVVKVFPATALGPGFFKDVRGPLPQVKLMPTGGVSLSNAGEWIKAGAVAIGVGTAMVDSKAVAANDWPAITDTASKFVAAVAAARG